MKKNRLIDERGSITVYVIKTMLFFTAFIISIFIMNSRKYAAQLEANANVQELYSKQNSQVLFNAHFAAEADKIPIYTKDQLLQIGLGKRIYIPQTKKIYYFVAENDKYIIQNNITGLTETEVTANNAKLSDYVENFGTLSNYYSFRGTNIIKNN